MINPVLKEKTVQIRLFLIFVIGFILRIMIIGDYGLSEDEVLKAIAVQEYLEFNFSGNAQHPAIMKIFATLSVLIFGNSEFALRLPNVIFASLTIYPIYYLGKELYDETIGYFSAVLWSISVTIISFSTTAKEDSIFTFFWILVIYYIVKSRTNRTYLPKVGIALGLTYASKYMGVIIIPVIITLYYIFKKEESDLYSFTDAFKIIFKFATLAFLIANFPIFLPDTLSNLYNHYILNQKIAPPRNGFIMMDQLFHRRPIYYLFLYFLVKVPVPILITFVIGLYETFRNPKLSNRILYVWIIIPLALFSLMSGYARYLMIIMPAFFYISSIGICKLATIIVSFSNRFSLSPKVNNDKIISYSLTFLISLNLLISGFVISPNYRMYVNEIGGGDEKVGYYFPQDSVYDYQFREAIEYLNKNAPLNSVIATHIPVVAEYYARSDLTFLHVLELPLKISMWQSLNISYAIIQQSRIYEQNIVQVNNLENQYTPEISFLVLNIVVAVIYNLNN